MLIHSLDDPICDTLVLPYELIKNNENCILVTVNGTGHVEYCSGYNARRWAWDVGIEFLNIVQIENDRGQTNLTIEENEVY